MKSPSSLVNDHGCVTKWRDLTKKKKRIWLNIRYIQWWRYIVVSSPLFIVFCAVKAASQLCVSVSSSPPLCVLTLLLMVCKLSNMVTMASDMRLGRERSTLSTPDGPSKRSATCFIVSTETGGTVSMKTVWDESYVWSWFSCIRGTKATQCVGLTIVQDTGLRWIPCVWFATHPPNASTRCWGQPGWPDSPSWRCCSSWHKVWRRACPGSGGSKSSSSWLAYTPGSGAPGVGHGQK